MTNPYVVTVWTPIVEVGMGYFDAGMLQEDRMEENDPLSILTLPYVEPSKFCPYLSAQFEQAE